MHTFSYTQTYTDVCMCMCMHIDMHMTVLYKLAQKMNIKKMCVERQFTF